MSLFVFKVLAFVAILATGLAGGFVSIRLAASSRSERLFSLGNALVGGIFLGAGLIHMLPDAQESLGDLLGDFPWVSLFCAAGFLLVLVLEKVLVHSHHALAESAEQESSATLHPYVLTLR